MTHLLRRLGLAAIVYTSLNFSAEAQITTVYSEDFDSPPHNVTTFHTQAGPSPYWNDTTALKVSGTHSYHANVLPQDTVYFQTLAALLPLTQRSLLLQPTAPQKVLSA